MVHTPAILIADDDDVVVQTLAQWFETRGFNVDVARDGLEAVAKCQERIYDVVTMDIEMPRLGGIEAIRLLKEFSPATPVIALTGYASDPDLPKHCRADKICAKPIALSALEREVRVLLRPGTASKDAE